MSYTIDVYRGEVAATRNAIDFSSYVLLFPQLVAGPIVRYREVDAQLRDRRLSLPMIFDGMWRTSLGLGKKVIIADNLGRAADVIFSLPDSQMTCPLAWAGAVLYAFQLYFDFSGYSDMAIGFAKMIGFSFPENFNQPYRAASVTEFWRRWHMTLTGWLRDYLYVPLGGNRGAAWKTYRNLVITFLLCGLWHGAEWSFVIWGAYNGALLILERAIHSLLGWRTKGILGIALTFMLVLVGWVFFRSPTLTQAWHHLATMFQPVASGAPAFTFSHYVSNATLGYLSLAMVFSFLPWDWLRNSLDHRSPVVLLKGAVSVILLAVSISYLVGTSYSPFIYFRF